MPLCAIVEGETLIGPELSEKEWKGLKARHKQGLLITMGCCGAPGHLRVSKNGTQHFYHAVDTGCHYAEESREHLEIKYAIYRACKAEGWETYVEFPSSDRTWISDVYAARDGQKIVFEVQLSIISPSELEERDKKYRAKGIESYWLLDNFLEKSKEFASWYASHLFEKDKRAEETIPYIDPSLFETGPENHIFIVKGIRSVGLSAKDQTLFTTNNPEIPLPVWVREVLKGNYRNYLEETAAAYRRKHRLMTMAAPALIRFREFYRKIVRDKTYRVTAGHAERMSKTGTMLRTGKAGQKKFHDLYAEIDWLENEYRSYVSDSYGLFTWKKDPEHAAPRLYFRLESELNVKKLRECTEMFARWEASFEGAVSNPER